MNNFQDKCSDKLFYKLSSYLQRMWRHRPVFSAGPEIKSIKNQLCYYEVFPV